MKKQSQHGIAHLGILLLLLVVAVIALAGYKVAKNHDAVTSSNTPSTAQVKTIQSKADLTSVETTLNQADLDKDLSPDSLTNDINSLL